MIPPLDAEWLEPDGVGGYAMGTVGGTRTRRYHALLLAAMTPPTGRMVLVSGVEAWFGNMPLSTHRYAPDVQYPDGVRHLASFSTTPWPTWRFQWGGREIEHDIFTERSSGAVVLRWRLLSGAPGPLTVRPLLAARDYHSLRREGPFRMDADGQGGCVSWRPDSGGPAFAGLSNGTYAPSPQWFRNFLYTVEQDRGMDCIEDLASPGLFTFDLQAEAVLMFRQGDGTGVDPAPYAALLAAAERRRRGAFTGPWAQAADAYVVRRGQGRTILAGFPWFTDWGRDTFIALRGLLIGTGRLEESAAVLLAWAGLVDRGMLPNRFPDQGNEPEFNSVDAALWFCVAVHDHLAAGGAGQDALRPAVERIIEGYVAGTRYNIGVDGDGLVRAGTDGVQLTWMDAKCGDWVVTPRQGKPVEIQALWINALRIAAGWTPRWAALERQATASMLALFPDPATGGLVDVIGWGGEPDRAVRPNQIFAVGGLPFAVFNGEAAEAIVALVEARLLTPLGLRTLDPDDAAYQGAYRGDLLQRDGAYHQGTVWPWLMGPYVEAALRTRGPQAALRLREQCLAPLLEHMGQYGLGHVSEVADGNAPNRPGGCPFQAWSLGELIRIERMLEATKGHTSPPNS